MSATRTNSQISVSRIVSIALRMLGRVNPGIRAVLSYADPEHGHVGGIYQAGGWFYVGRGGSQEAFFDEYGKRIHSRSISVRGVKKQFGSFGRPHRKASEMRRVVLQQKHKYLMPLDPDVRARIAALSKPYPKRERSAENGTAVPTARGGVIPTRSLQTQAQS